MVPKILCGNFENVFLECLQYDLPAFRPRKFCLIFNNIESKSTDCWLVNEESIFA